MVIYETWYVLYGTNIYEFYIITVCQIYHPNFSSSSVQNNMTKDIFCRTLFVRAFFGKNVQINFSQKYCKPIEKVHEIIIYYPVHFHAALIPFCHANFMPF